MKHLPVFALILVVLDANEDIDQRFKIKSNVELELNVKDVFENITTDIQNALSKWNDTAWRSDPQFNIFNYPNGSGVFDGVVAGIQKTFSRLNGGLNLPSINTNSSGSEQKGFNLNLRQIPITTLTDANGSPINPNVTKNFLISLGAALFYLNLPDMIKAPQFNRTSPFDDAPWLIKFGNFNLPFPYLMVGNFSTTSLLFGDESKVNKKEGGSSSFRSENEPASGEEIDLGKGSKEEEAGNQERQEYKSSFESVQRRFLKLKSKVELDIEQKGSKSATVPLFSGHFETSGNLDNIINETAMFEIDIA